jgi:hypothetical protein
MTALKRCSLDALEKLVILYGIIGRIRLVANEEVLAEAESCCERIVELYAGPNKTVEQIASSFNPNKLDPIRQFSSVCRADLSTITQCL